MTDTRGVARAGLVEEPPLVLHLNGGPGVGKSTLARLWAERHPGTLLLDVDVLRTWISGWRADFVGTGAVVRPAALALLSSYVAEGGPVVLPQLLADPCERERFRDAAVGAGGRWCSVLVTAPDAASRFAARPLDEPHLEAVHALVEAAPDSLAAYGARLAPLEHDLILPTVDGDAAGAVDRLAAALGDHAG